MPITEMKPRHFKGTPRNWDNKTCKQSWDLTCNGHSSLTTLVVWQHSSKC